MDRLQWSLRVLKEVLYNHVDNPMPVIGFFCKEPASACSIKCINKTNSVPWSICQCIVSHG